VVTVQLLYAACDPGASLDGGENTLQRLRRFLPEALETARQAAAPWVPRLEQTVISIDDRARFAQLAASLKTYGDKVSAVAAAALYAVRSGALVPVASS
jgi:hypothetical protein